MYRGRLVGTLAAMPDKRIAFQYSRQWLQEGFALNPLSLPLKDKVYIPGYEPFGGLFGVFADSLPDGWGRLLVDRFLLKNNFVPGKIGNLERLAIVADSGMGHWSIFLPVVLCCRIASWIWTRWRQSARLFCQIRIVPI